MCVCAPVCVGWVDVKSRSGLNVPVCLHNIKQGNLGRTYIWLWGGGRGKVVWPLFSKWQTGK